MIVQHEMDGLLVLGATNQLGEPLDIRQIVFLSCAASDHEQRFLKASSDRAIDRDFLLHRGTSEDVKRFLLAHPRFLLHGPQVQTGLVKPDHGRFREPEASELPSEVEPTLMDKLGARLLPMLDA